MPVIVMCDYCFADKKVKPSKVKKLNFCDKECRRLHTLSKIKTYTCSYCGKQYERQYQKPVERHFCSKRCNMRKMNEELNPTRMTEEVKAKISFTRTGVVMPIRKRRKLKRVIRTIESYTLKELTEIAEKVLQVRGYNKSYPKLHGVHLHRVVAEVMIGRPLKEGEVVHHRNENVNDARPCNLHIFDTQAEHARHHKILNKINHV